MRENIWRNILLVRTFFGQSARGMLRRETLVSAVPRLRKSGWAKTVRARSPLGGAVRMAYSGTRETSSTRSVPGTGKPTGLRNEAHFSRRKGDEVSMLPSFPVRSVVALAGNKGRITRISTFPNSPRQMSQLRVKQDKIVSNKKRINLVSRRVVSLERRSGLLERIFPSKSTRRVGSAASSVVLEKMRRSGNSVFVPQARPLFAGEGAYGTTGEEQKSQHVFSGGRSYHETEIVNDRLEHEVRSGDFLLGHRDARLAARRSGGGVDEIMQPQYPGRSIGFF